MTGKLLFDRYDMYHYGKHEYADTWVGKPLRTRILGRPKHRQHGDI